MYEDLIVSAMPMAERIAIRNRGGLDRDEARSVAYFALTKAAARFDRSRGVSFAGYATPCIIGALKDAMRSSSQVGNFRTIGEVETVSLDAEAAPQIAAPTVSQFDSVDLKRALLGIRKRGQRTYIVAQMMVAGWPDSDIRAVLGMSAGLLDSTRGRVKSLLRQEMAKPRPRRRRLASIEASAYAHCLPVSTVRMRLWRAGETLATAFREPGWNINGVSLSFRRWGKIVGKSPSVIERRLKAGVDPMAALLTPAVRGGWGTFRKRKATCD